MHRATLKSISTWQWKTAQGYLEKYINLTTKNCAGLHPWHSFRCSGTLVAQHRLRPPHWGWTKESRWSYKKKDLIQLCIQVGLVLYMRDSLVLMVVTFVVRSEKVWKIVFNITCWIIFSQQPWTDQELADLQDPWGSWPGGNCHPLLKLLTFHI